MIETEVIAAAVVGTVVYFLFGWLVFEVLLGPFMKARTTSIDGFLKSPEESSMLMLLVSCASYALLLAILMSKDYLDIRNFPGGVDIGATVGILVAIMTNSYWFATTHFFNNLAPVLADVAAAGLTVGVMGGVVGVTLDYFGKTAAPGEYNEL